MDFTTKELLKRYAKLAVGQPFSPILLNILVTSVCDMRCTHCFFTDELDDRPRKKLQMKTHEIEKISETLGGNLGVLILAGGEPFTRKDLPEIARAFYKNNQLESIYIMSNGQIQKRIFPDVTRVLQECPNLNVTVALGIDGLKTEHEKIRQKSGSCQQSLQLPSALSRFFRADLGRHTYHCAHSETIRAMESPNRAQQRQILFELARSLCRVRCSKENPAADNWIHVLAALWAIPITSRLPTGF